jgi:NADPH:quinone reductase
MKAAWFEKFGSANEALIVGDLPKPEAGPGEVLVRLHTTGVNPSDVKKRAGAFPTLLDGGLVIPHSDSACLSTKLSMVGALAVQPTM